MKQLVNLLTLSVAIMVIFSCQNELTNGTVNNSPATTRAEVPADAIVIPDTTTVFQFENNKSYVISSGTIRARKFNSSSYENVNLYVQGTWDIPADGFGEEGLTLPTGLNVTILDGGEVLTRLQDLYILRGTNILIAEGGTFRTETTTNVTLGDNSDEIGGTLTNYGNLTTYLLDASSGYFYNLNPGVFSYYIFNMPSESSRYVNTGTIINL